VPVGQGFATTQEWAVSPSVEIKYYVVPE